MDFEMRLYVDDEVLGDWCFDFLIIYFCIYVILNNIYININGYKKIKRFLVEIV